MQLSLFPMMTAENSAVDEEHVAFSTGESEGGDAFAAIFAQLRATLIDGLSSEETAPEVEDAEAPEEKTALDALLLGLPETVEESMSASVAPEERPLAEEVVGGFLSVGKQVERGMDGAFLETDPVEEGVGVAPKPLFVESGVAEEAVTASELISEGEEALLAAESEHAVSEELSTPAAAKDLAKASAPVPEMEAAAEKVLLEGAWRQQGLKSASEEQASQPKAEMLAEVEEAPLPESWHVLRSALLEEGEAQPAKVASEAPSLDSSSVEEEVLVSSLLSKAVKSQEKLVSDTKTETPATEKAESLLSLLKPSLKEEEALASELLTSRPSRSWVVSEEPPVRLETALTGLAPEQSDLAPEASEEQVPESRPVTMRSAASEAPLKSMGAEKASAPEATRALPEAVSLDKITVTTVRNVRYLVNQGGQTMTVRLVPESLGEMQLEVHHSGDELTVKMISGNAMVRDALEAQVGGLREALSREGLEVSRVEVSSTLSSNVETGQQASQEASQERRAQDQASSPGQSYSNPATERKLAAPQEALAHEGALNLFV